MGSKGDSNDKGLFGFCSFIVFKITFQISWLESQFWNTK